MSDDPAELLKRAEARHKARDYAGSLEDYSRLVEIEPDKITHWIDRARVRLILNDAEGALADLKEAARRDERNIRLWYYRGYAEAPLDRSAARESFTLAANIDPTDADGHYYRGLALECLDRHAEAGADFIKAVELAPADHPERGVLEAKAKAYARPSPSKALKGAYFTWILAGINIAVMLLFSELLVKATSEELIARGALERTKVWEGESWRLLTCVFLHIGWMHLAWNIYGGYWLCSAVERTLGHAKFLAAYLLTGIGASAVSLLCHHAVAAGSSGAIFGVEGVFLMIFYHRLGGAKAFFADRWVRRILWNTALWFVFGMTILPMDNYAHAGGLFFGLLLGWLFLMGPSLAPARRVAMWVGGLGLLAATSVASVIPWYGDSAEWRGYLKAVDGDEAFERKEWAEAERLYDEAIRNGYEDPSTWVGRAKARAEQGNLAGAESDLKEALARNPGFGPGHWALGDLAWRKEDFPAAVTAYTEAIRLGPGDCDLHYNRAYVRERTGDKNGAIEDYRKALELAPRDWSSRAEVEEELKRLTP